MVRRTRIQNTEYRIQLLMLSIINLSIVNCQLSVFSFHDGFYKWVPAENGLSRLLTGEIPYSNMIDGAPSDYHRLTIGLGVNLASIKCLLPASLTLTLGPWPLGRPLHV